MPTFFDPLADAAEASEAMHALAHASRAFQNPTDAYTLLGDLLAGVRSLRQVLDQLADAHLVHRARAFDDAGDQAAGASAALAAADELHQAATLVDEAETRLDAASQASGRIAWHPAAREKVPGRWVSVVFLEGQEADEVLEVVAGSGVDAAIDQLSGYDYGEETTQLALEDGHVYDTPPSGPLDRVALMGEYALTYSPFLGHVHLLRAHASGDDVPLRNGVSPAQAGRHTATSSPDEAAGWFASRSRPGSDGRGLAL